VGDAKTTGLINNIMQTETRRKTHTQPRNHATTQSRVQGHEGTRRRASQPHEEILTPLMPLTRLSILERAATTAGSTAAAATAAAAAAATTVAQAATAACSEEDRDSEAAVARAEWEADRAVVAKAE